MSESPTIEAVKRALDATHADGVAYMIKQGEHTILGYGGDLSKLNIDDWLKLKEYVEGLRE